MSGSLKARLVELNYLFPFSKESEPLIEALLSDLVSTVTTFKELETEHEITKEELRLAVEEINRVGVVENPRLVSENNALHVRVMKEASAADEKTSLLRAELHEADSRAMKLELFVSQLSFDNHSLLRENGDLRARIEQLLADEQQSVDDLHQIWLSRPLSRDDDGPAEFPLPLQTPDLSEQRIRDLGQDNAELMEEVASLRSALARATSEYKTVEEKFLQQSPVTLSGNWIGFGPNQQQSELLVKELNEKLDFVNGKYRELRQLHDRCGIVTDSPLTDLRQFKQELVRVKEENATLRETVNQLRLSRPQPRAASKSPKKSAPKTTETGSDPLSDLAQESRELMVELRQLKRENEELKRELKQASNEVKIKEKEIRLVKNTAASPVRGGQDNRRLVGELALTEEKLRQVTEDRDELIEKLSLIEKSIEAMEAEVLHIEAENVELKREKLAKEESFVGISKQINEVNLILNSLSSEMGPTEQLERLKFRITQLEREIAQKDEEISQLRNAQRDLQIDQSKRVMESASSSRVVELEKQLFDLQSLTKSLAAAKQQALDQLKQLQSELDLKRVEHDRAVRETTVSSTTRQEMEGKIAALTESLRQLDAERDELQRLCDDQAEKLDVLRAACAQARSDLAAAQQRSTTAQLETDRLRQILEEKERELSRLNRAVNELKSEVSMKDSLVATGQREVTEISQSLANHNNMARGEADTLMENLRITEHERNDVLSLYRQALEENKRVAAERARMEDLARLKEAELVRAANVNQQLVRELERSKMNDRQSGRTRDELSDLLSLVETERARNRELQSHIRAISESGVPSAELTELQRTIEQQYVLIGEMDSEQARLIVENSKLRERLQ